MTDFCDMCEREVEKTTGIFARNIRICKKCETDIKSMEEENEYRQSIRK